MNIFMKIMMVSMTMMTVMTAELMAHGSYSKVEL